MPRGCLVIHHRADDNRWPDVAAAYWENRLPGLVVVPSSTFAHVQRRVNHFFKRYLVRGGGDAIKNLFRPSRARRALQRGEEIDALGFHAPRSVCLVEERRFGFLRDCALVTEAIDQAPNFREWLNNPTLGVAGSRPRKRALLRAVAEEVARWHSAGLHHADMRIGNILCRSRGGPFDLFWLDNEGVRRRAQLPEGERIHNLMQLNMERTGVTLTDRMFFWNCYAARASIPRADARRIMRGVIRYTQQRWKERGWL